MSLREVGMGLGSMGPAHSFLQLYSLPEKPLSLPAPHPLLLPPLPGHFPGIQNVPASRPPMPNTLPLCLAPVMKIVEFEATGRRCLGSENQLLGVWFLKGQHRYRVIDPGWAAGLLGGGR